MSQGGTRTRPGTRFVAALPGAFPVRLEPFVFAEDQRYVIAFAPARFDVWTSAGTYAGGATGAPWTAATLGVMRVLASGDTVVILHPSFAPQRALRVGALAFTLSALPIEIPALTRYVAPSVTLAVSAVGAPGTTSVATFSAPVMTAAWVGRWVRFKGKLAVILSVTDAQNATIQWVDSSVGLSGAATPDQWFEQAWTLESGFPSAGAFFGNRLFLCANTAKPNGVWGSKVGAYFNFDTGTALDDEGIASAWTAEEGVPRIRHAIAQQRLVFLGDRGVGYVAKSDDNPITPKNFRIVQVGEAGAATVAPAIFDNAILWLDQTRRVVREALWNDGSLSYSTDAVSLIAEHLIEQPTQVAAYEGAYSRPERLAVLTNGTGRLAVFHSVRAEKVAAWMPWETQGAFLSAAGVGPDLFVATSRNGSLWLERFDPDAEALDASRQATLGSPGRVFPGFAHLAGRRVQLVSRGHYLGEATVAGDGTITLPPLTPDVNLLEAGFSFAQRIRPMPADADLGDGPGRGLMKRLIRVIVQCDRSGSFRIAGKDVLLDFSGTNATTPASARTGLIEFRMRQVDRECQFDLVVPQPQKVTVLGMTREISVNG